MKGNQDTGILLGRIQPSIKKIAVFNLLLLILSYVLSPYLFNIYAHTFNFDYTWHLIFCSIIYVVFAFSSWKFLFKKPELLIHYNGLVIRNMGFLPWGTFSLKLDGSELILMAVPKISGISEDKWDKKALSKAGVSKIVELPASVSTLVKQLHFSFPVWWSNQGADQFFVEFRRANPETKGNVANDQPNHKRERLVVWLLGSATPGVKEVFVSLVLFMTAGLMLYPVFIKGYFMSASWKEIGGFIYWIAALSILLTLLWGEKRGRLKYMKVPVRKSFRALYLVLVAFGGAFALVWVPYGWGMGGLITKMAGTPYEIEIVVKEKDVSSRMGHYVEPESLSPDMIASLFSKINVSEDDYKIIETGEKMTLYGVKSWFGTLITSYEIAR